MKIFLSLLICLSFSNVAIAQTYTHTQDSLFQHLDKNRIASGALYNRVYPWAALHHFAPTDSIDFGRVYQAWHELYTCRYVAAGLDLSALERRLQQHRIEGQSIPIGYIHFDMQYLDTAAYSTGALAPDPNDSLPRDADTAISPYQSRRILMPLIAARHIADSMPYFYFDPALALTNGNVPSITAITLRYGSDSVVLQPGDRHQLDLRAASSGTLAIAIRIATTGGGLHTFPYWLIDFGTAAPMSASVTTDLCNSGDSSIKFWSGSSLQFQGYDESVATEGKGEYSIFYKLHDIAGTGCVKKLTKPIIILDGFDPLDARKISYDPTGDTTIWDMLATPGTHLGDSLRLKGFDVILLNFPEYTDSLRGIYQRDGGTDYIERNAMVLTRLIQMVNDSLIANVPIAADRQLVIVGPSMGGQISRYALAYMEEQYALTSEPVWKHNCRLWVSLDSPHEGANIPVSVQQCLYFLGVRLNQAEAATSLSKQLRNPAARQLLIEQLDGLDRTAYFHRRYYDSLAVIGIDTNGGYPVLPRRIALINGAANGTTNGVAAETRLQLEATTSFLGMDINAIDLTFKSMTSYGHQVHTFRGKVKDEPGWTFGLGYGYTWFADSTFTFGMEEEREKETIVALIPVITTNKGNYETRNYNSNGSMDVAPGSTNNTFNKIVEMMKPTLDRMISDTIIDHYHWPVNKEVHTFIPAVSALDFIDHDFHWHESFNTRDLICNNEIPFDAYFAPNVNQKHVSFTDSASAWVLQEILYGTPGCPYICTDQINQVGGDRYLCAGVNYTFSFDEPVPLGATTEWVVSTGLTIVSFTNNQVVVKHNLGDPIELNCFVKAIVTPKMSGQPCGAAKVIVKDGLSYGNIFKYQNNTHPSDSTKFITKVVPDLAGNQYSWQADIAATWTTISTDSAKIYSKIPLLDPTKYYYTRIYVDGCGTTTPSASLTGEYGRMGLMYEGDDTGDFRHHLPHHLELTQPTLVPNPTSTRWHLLLPPTWIATTGVVYIYSTDGKQVMSKSISGATLTELPVEDLTPGIYFIEVVSGAERIMLRGVKQ